MTATVAAVTAAVSVPALFMPGLVRALEQNPPALGRGQWWRAATPMVIQGYGWGQCCFNLLGIVLAGIAVERLVGAARWLAVYLAGGLVAITATSLLFPRQTDSGSSAAVAALIGAMVVPMARTRSLPPWPSLMYGVFFATYLGALALGGPVAGAVAGSLAVPVFVLVRAFAAPAILRRGSTAVVLAATVAMLAVGDAHGFGLAAGMLAALITTAHASPGSPAAHARGGDGP